MKRRGLKATESERLEVLLKCLRNESMTHGSPCMCLICESLVFDTMYRDGDYDISTVLKRIRK